jgi:hypothetical protein
VVEVMAFAETDNTIHAGGVTGNRLSLRALVIPGKLLAETPMASHRQRHRHRHRLSGNLDGAAPTDAVDQTGTSEAQCRFIYF